MVYASPEWNSCIGCNGQINETFDCAGTCGGHYRVNVCGYCLDTRSSAYDWAAYGVDCNGMFKYIYYHSHDICIIHAMLFDK